jgi:hypothetical protein
MIGPDDLLDPNGDIDLAMFPGKTTNEVNDILQAYVDRAYATLDVRGITDDGIRDAAARLYAYYLAADRVYRRVTNESASLTFSDDGGRTMIQSQIDSWGKRAYAYLEQFNTLAPEPTLPEGTSNKSSTTSVGMQFTW